MSADKVDRARELFDASLDLPSEERAAFLEKASGGDEQLRERVERLLRNAARATASVVVLPDAVETIKRPGDDVTFSEEVGTKIGSYTLRELIGEGGFGAVYRAQQEHPVSRQVALKIIKLGMDTKRVIARFEAERQALALMNHPHVARVFDAGSTDTGRPYFVMEYVPGEPVTDYCDRQLLSTRARLELFVQSCGAVQHAHQKGIIHRDLKPSNVLVSVEEGEASVKVIDFGVAKATAQPLTERTLFTERGELVGTPAYMSPEQAEGSPDIDTRTDVYSLGVLLYQLLTGLLPFDAKALRAAGYGEIQRIIREEEPPKPSTRLSRLDDISTAATKREESDPRTLLREIRGDLDWIVMRAMEKDRTRRYGSPQELAADIGRYLSDLPVLASPPSAAYRTRKFVRRHRVGVGVAAASVLVLVAFAGTMAVQAGRIARERDQVKLESETAKQVSEFLTGLFRVSDPGEARGNSITARELLDNGAKEIEEGLKDQPALQARLMGTMGRVYQNLGLYPRAEALIKQAVGTNRRVLGDDHADTLRTMQGLASVYYYQARFDEAEPLQFKVLETRRRVFGDEHPETLQAMNDLALVYVGQRRFDEAEPLYIEGLEAQRRVLGDDHVETLRSLGNLAGVYWNQGRFDEAEPLFIECLEAQRRVSGDDHPDTLSSLNNLALIYQAQGRYGEAELMYLETLEARKRVLGDRHPITATSLYNLACLAAVQGDKAKGLDWLRQSVDAGFNAAGWMPRDPDLESLHGSEFDTLVERARQNAADQRADKGSEGS